LVETIKEYKDYELKLIAVYAKNREEWILLDEACSLYNMTVVPIYDTLGPEAV
jgi:long-chain acyl-CoA synthetase